MSAPWQRSKFPATSEAAGNVQSRGVICLVTAGDSGARAVREFVPLVPGEVTIYLCGATGQSPPHIGHIRSGLDFDILRR